MLLFESPTISGFQFLMGLLVFIGFIGAAIITLLATRKNTVSSIQVQRAEASEALVKTRDIEVADCVKKCDACNEELEDVTSELRAQMSINVEQLMTYWGTRNSELAEMESLRQRNRILEIRVGDRNA